MRFASPRLLSIAVLLAPVAMAGCASTPGQVYIAPNERTVTARVEASYGGEGQHVVVENNSTVDVIVTSLHLRDCENIRNDCEVVRMRRTVKPGERHRLVTVQPDKADRYSNFSFSWTWEPAGAPPQIPGKPDFPRSES